MNDDQWALSNFRNRARLFPLPNLVLFPHVVQPLHVFEPRYRQMTADALGDDRLIALALLKPGWEDAGACPALHGTACLGRVVADQLLPDGRYNLLLRGLSRVRIVKEIDSGKMFRAARVEVISDRPPPLTEAKQLRQQLAEVVLPRFAAAGPALEQLRDLFQGELPLGALCDILGFALPVDIEHKQALLDQVDVALRVGLLLTALEATPAKPVVAGDRKFPPDFSAN
jgi:Lon protease-like protein